MGIINGLEVSLSICGGLTIYVFYLKYAFKFICKYFQEEFFIFALGFIIALFPPLFLVGTLK